MSARLAPGLCHGQTVRRAAVGDLLLTDVQYTDGARRHHHERAYFCLIRRGVYQETYGRRVRTCRAGMVVYHPPGESHAQAVRTASVAAFDVELGPDWLRRMREDGMPLDQPAESQDHAAVTLAERLARRHLSETHRPLSQIAAEAGFAAVDMALHANAARRRLGELVGGAAGDLLVRESDRSMAEQGIRHPARMTAALAPGAYVASPQPQQSA